MLFFLLGTVGLGLGYVLNEVFSSDQNYEENVSLTLDASGTPEANNTVDQGTETTTFISPNSVSFSGSETDNEFNLGNISSDTDIQTFGGNDTVTSGSGSDTIDAGNGDDRVQSGDRGDVVTLGSGNDYWSDIAGRGSSTWGGNDNVFGGNGNDTLSSLGGADTLFGNEGNDMLDGEDIVPHEPGEQHKDFLSGGSGNDSIYAYDGDTVLTGSGEDVVTLFSNSDFRSEDAVVIKDFDPTKDVLQIMIPNELQTSNMSDVTYKGTDGSTITIAVGGIDIVTLESVYFSELNENNFILY